MNREKFEEYKDNYFTSTINNQADVVYFEMKNSILITEDQDFIKKFKELEISNFDIVEEVSFRESED